MSDDLTTVGKNLERIGGRGKVTGEVRYVADLRLPGMLVAKLLRSPHAHAQVTRLETGAARRLEGVNLQVLREGLEIARVHRRLEQAIENDLTGRMESR